MCLLFIKLFARNPVYLNCMHAIISFNSCNIKEISIQMGNLANRLRLKLGDQLLLTENADKAPNGMSK